MSIRLAIQLISPQIISGVKVEDALTSSTDLGLIPQSLNDEVMQMLAVRTGGLEVDKWLVGKKIKPSASARMQFLSSFQ